MSGTWKTMEINKLESLLALQNKKVLLLVELHKLWPLRLIEKIMNEHDTRNICPKSVFAFDLFTRPIFWHYPSGLLY